MEVLILALVMVGCVTIIAVSRKPTIKEVETIVHIPYVPEALLMLAGFEPASAGGYITTVGGLELWYVNDIWKYHYINPIQQRDDWLLIKPEKVFAFLEASAKLHQGQSYQNLPANTNGKKKRQLSNSDVDNALKKRLVFDSSEKDHMLLPGKCHWEHPGADADEWIIVRN
jgi:hypothetical protein